MTRIGAPPASDLTQGVELARGGAGSGLSWSPGGGELVAALDGRLEVLSADGRLVERVPTGNGTVSYPLWVRTNTIWYEAGSGSGARVRQVTR